jgi:hypothetical protein
MNTLPGLGLYQVLREHTAATGRKNVLVGYSQGGLVARYLAYLDENLAVDPPCIHGVVAVQAPLRGSPVADPDNAGRIAGALTDILISLFSRAPTPPQGAPFDVRQGGHFFSALALVLGAVVEVNRRRPGREWLVDVLRTARKWISGLSEEGGLAFFDLNPVRLGDAGSVLHAVDAFPLQGIWHGAVIGTDVGLEPFARGLFQRHFCTRVLEAIFRGAVERYVGPAQHIFQREAMHVPGSRESSYPPALDRLRRDWLFGTRASGVPIDPMAHDFVIPSASEMMLDDDGPAFLGNAVNPDASHLSGASLETKHPTDLELTCAMLQRMIAR